MVLLRLLISILKFNLQLGVILETSYHSKENWMRRNWLIGGHWKLGPIWRMPTITCMLLHLPNLILMALAIHLNFLGRSVLSLFVKVCNFFFYGFKKQTLHEYFNLYRKIFAHFRGILLQGAKRFEEAIECYKNAIHYRSRLACKCFLYSFHIHLSLHHHSATSLKSKILKLFCNEEGTYMWINWMVKRFTNFRLEMVSYIILMDIEQLKGYLGTKKSFAF